ncbi:Piso0_005558 [Millerozyma farinosa CBS 7064]|uniref:Piso0_005558 protein n=1 Tax=Pichia sorbitophila (strain ATCC MYA-4447 / BCRC 22081 / CBS 7064 / NBRC 10061 / NRRL Y-12695) TaxID=559304 RepID=G8XZB5_PICSO|nr:Piso0_005558 [Millerozyma farinosa CBS 7064]
MSTNSFLELLNGLDEKKLHGYFIELNLRLTQEKASITEAEYIEYLNQISVLIEKYHSIEDKADNDGSKSAGTQENSVKSKKGCSSNLVKLISRNVVLILENLTSKIYDFVNNLLNYINLDTKDEFRNISGMATILLIDLFERFPNYLSTLVNFSVSQVYKILKKKHDIDSNLVYLLSIIMRNASKGDIEEKAISKIYKLSVKCITQSSITFETAEENHPSKEMNITLVSKRYWINVLKDTLILQVTTNYETLLSASMSSSGSKLKPESIMAHQNQFQISLLTNNEKVFLYGLGNPCKEIRISMVHLLAYLLFNFIPTGSFNTVEYLFSIYEISGLKSVKEEISTSLSLDSENYSADSRSDRNSISKRDSEQVILSRMEILYRQSSIIETIIFYIQLEQFQHNTYLSSNLTDILDLTLSKLHVFLTIDAAPNFYSNVIFKQFSKFLHFLVSESGPNCHETLIVYLCTKFNLDDSSNEDAHRKTSRNTSDRSRKRESVLFNFKVSKKSSKGKSKEEIKSEIHPYHNSYQCGLLLSIIDILLPFGTDFDTAVQELHEDTKSTSSHGERDEQVNRSDHPVESKEESRTSNNQFLLRLLFDLLINNHANIRYYALRTLLQFSSSDSIEINELILRLHQKVSQEYNSSEDSSDSLAYANSQKNICPFIQVRLMSYSLALSSIIKQTPPLSLQNSTIVKVLSFCTQNLKHNSNSKVSRNSACWLILSSLITLYNNSEFVKLNSSQILVFWKSLLTSQFISTSISKEELEKNYEIVDNLILRNFSLICLSNYLSSVDLTPESLKSLQFLLIKAYNYLSYLESNIDGVAAVTSFLGHQFNESDYDPTIINNIHFSNHISEGKLSYDRVIISLILYSKYIILQCYIKLSSYLKSEINANMVIFLVKLFSDTKIFSRCDIDHMKEKSNNSKVKNKSKFSDLDPDSLLLGDTENYSFGVTSKFRGHSANIDELLVKFPLASKAASSFTNDVLFHDYLTCERRILLTDSSKETENDLENNYYSWLDGFEADATHSVDNSIIYDPIIHLTHPYSKYQNYASNIITSLVDVSIELFQVIFPHLSSKIKTSLLEQMYGFLTVKNLDPFRYKAVAVNLSVALHGLLHGMQKKNIKLEKEIILFILEIIDKIELHNSKIILLNCDSIGIACHLLSDDKGVVVDHVNKCVKRLVSDTDFYHRGYNLLALGKIYRATKIGFSDAFNAVQQLLKDPNPIVYHYALRSSILLLEDNLGSLKVIPDILGKVYDNHLDDVFSKAKGTALANLKCTYGSANLTAALLKTCINTLGPYLRESSNGIKQIIKELIVSFAYNIGSWTMQETLDLYKHVLELSKEIIIFDPTIFKNQISFFCSMLDFLISKNLKIGISPRSPTSINMDAIFPFDTSFELYRVSFEFYTELVKVYGAGILQKGAIKLLWTALSVKPCPELKQLIILWIESSYDINWFLTLLTLYRSSALKLVYPFIEVNFQQKLLPIKQREKKSKNEISLKDEEIENIVTHDGEAASQDNDAVIWEFRLFVYELLYKLICFAEYDNTFLNKLKLKIQDLINICFFGSTAPIVTVRRKALRLLDKVLEVFGQLDDPLYPGVSILEQQQAQIISALMPFFKGNNDAESIVEAINVSSKFINISGLKFYSKQRILRNLTYLLEEISSNKFLRFECLESMSEYGKKSIQLAILNCWASFKLNMLQNVNEKEPELAEALNKYSTLLNSLWILVLREYATLKYSESRQTELELFEKYWINFVNVLTIELQDKEFGDQYLYGDSQNFLFILFSLCFESLSKNKNTTPILNSLLRLVHNPELVQVLLNDEVFPEVIDLFDRLMMTEESVEIKVKLIEIAETIFGVYLDSTEGKNVQKDRILELLRIYMLPVFSIIPFIRNDFDPTLEYSKYLLAKVDSGPNLIMLKKSFQCVTGILPALPGDISIDISSCLFVIFIKIYESKNEHLIASILPLMKQVIIITKQLESGNELVNIFSRLLRENYELNGTRNSVVTTTLLLTCADISFDERETNAFVDSLTSLISSKDEIPLLVSCMRSIAVYSATAEKGMLVLKLSIKKYIETIFDKAADVESVFAVLLATVSVDDFSEDKLVSLYSVVILLTLKLYGSAENSVSSAFLRDKMLFLVSKNPIAFKKVITSVLTPDQRLMASEITNQNSATEQQDLPDEPVIELKVFGS